MKSRYVRHYYDDKSMNHIYFNLKNGLSIKTNNNVFASFEEMENHNQLFGYLSENKFISEPNEVEEIWNNYKEEFRESEMFLVIMPHQNCNFRCVYCYEKFEKNKMTVEVENSILLFVEKEFKKNKNLKKLKVSWFGGEPLLAKDIIFRLSKKFIELCEQNNIKYSAHMTSNAYLLDETTFRKLLDVKVESFQITLDGTKDTHDKQRILRGGQSTYERIVNNLKNGLEFDRNFLITLRMNVGPSNLSSVDDFIDSVNENFKGDKRYEIYFQDIRYWGGENRFEGLPPTIGIDLQEKVIEKNAWGCSVKNLYRKNSSCFAASPNSFVLGVDGLVYKCTIALYEDFNIVGHLDVNGEMHLDKEKMSLWTEGGVNDSTCRSCDFSPVCHGDTCPLKRIKNPDIQPCPVEKNETAKVLSTLDRQNGITLEIQKS